MKSRVQLLTASQSTGDYTAFATTREAEVIGANFHVVSDRDLTAYVVTVPRINAEKAAHILASAATSPLRPSQCRALM